MLSRELKALTESGLIDRKDFGVVPPKVEYRLTRKGRTFVPVVAAIKDWGERHLAEAAAARWSRRSSDAVIGGARDGIAGLALRLLDGCFSLAASASIRAGHVLASLRSQ